MAEGSPTDEPFTMRPGDSFEVSYEFTPKDDEILGRPEGSEPVRLLILGECFAVGDELRVIVRSGEDARFHAAQARARQAAVRKRLRAQQ